MLGEWSVVTGGGVPSWSWLTEGQLPGAPSSQKRASSKNWAHHVSSVHQPFLSHLIIVNPALYHLECLLHGPSVFVDRLDAMCCVSTGHCLPSPSP